MTMAKKNASDDIAGDAEMVCNELVGPTIVGREFDNRFALGFAHPRLHVRTDQTKAT